MAPFTDLPGHYPTQAITPPPPAITLDAVPANATVSTATAASSTCSTLTYAGGLGDGTWTLSSGFAATWLKLVQPGADNRVRLLQTKSVMTAAPVAAHPVTVTVTEGLLTKSHTLTITVVATSGLYPASSPYLTSAEGGTRPASKVVTEPAGTIMAGTNGYAPSNETEIGATVDLRRCEIWSEVGSPFSEDTTPPYHINPDGTSNWPPNSQVGENNNKNGIDMDNVKDSYAIVGGKFSGHQHRSVPYRLHKDATDGIALFINCVVNAYIYFHGNSCVNVHDGWGVREQGTQAGRPAGFDMVGCYADYVRDDVIENDIGLDCNIKDCFLAGHMWYGARPGNSDTPNHLAYFEDCLGRLLPMPWDGDFGGRLGNVVVNGKAHGHWVKCRGNGFTFKMKNCVLRMDQAPNAASKSVMGTNQAGLNEGGLPDWPGCTYDGCTMCWFGSGNYPGWAPGHWSDSEIKVLTSTTTPTAQSFWDAAVATWVANHPGAIPT